MLRSILVPVDGSLFAEHAVPPAIQLARRTGAALHIVRVHQPPVPPAPEAPIVQDSSWLESIREEEQRYLEQLVARALHATGGTIQATLIDGFPADAISRFAREHEISLIVMTTHGRGGFSRFWLGSVADGVVRQSNTPVLLLRPSGGEVDWERRLLLRHVLIAQDGSDLSRAVIEPTIALGALEGARYTLLRVSLPLPPLPHPFAVAAPSVGAAAEQEQLERDRVALNKEADKLRERGYDVDAVVVMHPNPASAILEYAATNAVDVIALATRGRSGWSRAALGSVADKVMRGSTVPVLLYRPPAPGAGAPKIVEQEVAHA